MKRQIVFCLLTTALLSIAPFVEAQQPKKVYRIGYLSARMGMEAREEVFRKRLPDLGYVEGQNIVIDWRFAEERRERLSLLAKLAFKNRG